MEYHADHFFFLGVFLPGLEDCWVAGGGMDYFCLLSLSHSLCYITGLTITITLPAISNPRV
jgi:hypothetical protein